jgi:hypothetical protein
LPGRPCTRSVEALLSSRHAELFTGAGALTVVCGRLQWLDDVVFLRPVQIGAVVQFRADIQFTDPTTHTVVVRVDCKVRRSP